MIDHNKRVQNIEQISAERKMWDMMSFGNGQIRVQPGRYGGGWLALGTLHYEIDTKEDELWSDLVGGDNDYFDARDFFRSSKNIVFIEHANDARSAFEKCVAGLVSLNCV